MERACGFVGDVSGRNIHWCVCVMQVFYQCADDVLLNCTLEIYMVLETNVTPISSLKIKREKMFQFLGSNVNTETHFSTMGSLFNYYF